MSNTKYTVYSINPLMYGYDAEYEVIGRQDLNLIDAMALVYELKRARPIGSMIEYAYMTTDRYKEYDRQYQGG